MGGGSAAPSDNCFVQGLPANTTEDQVRNAFSGLGQVARCKVLSNPGGCAALVQFGSAEEAGGVIEMVKSMDGWVDGFTQAIEIRFKDAPKGKDGGKGGYDQGKGGYGKAFGGKQQWPAPYAGGAGGKGAGGKGKGEEPGPSDNLYVTGLPPDTTVEEVQEVFSGYGTVKQAKIAFQDDKRATALVRFDSVEAATEVKTLLDGNIPQGLDRLQEALGIRFADPPKWQQEATGGGAWGGQAPSKGGGKGHAPSFGKGSFSMKTVTKGFEGSNVLPGSGTSWTEGTQVPLFIKGLPADCSDVDLYKIFSCFGAIAPKGCRSMTNPDGSCKGFAFVNFLETTAADSAIQTLDGTVLPDGYSKLGVAYKTPSKTA